MNNILLVDFGSTFTKMTAVDIDSEQIVGQAKAPTTIQTDILDGFYEALGKIKKTSPDFQYHKLFAASSAGGGLKIIAIGIVPDLTVSASKMAAYNAGGKVSHFFSYELTKGDVQAIDDSQPDIVLFTGGTDGGNKKILLKNAAMLAAGTGNYTVLVACNRAVADEVVETIEASGKKVLKCQNVMPKLEVLQIEPARDMIRQIFMQDIIKAKGLSQLEAMTEGEIMPTPAAVMQGIALLAEGCPGELGLGDLMAVDIGGATTDVYSAAKGMPRDNDILLKGLVEPYVKRTVEGDLGVRYNAESIASEVGLEFILEESHTAEEDALKWLELYREVPATLPSDEPMKSFDLALAGNAAKLAVKRHSGQYEIVFTPNGPVTIQTGKDLREVKALIGTGGPIIYSKDAKAVLKKACFEDEDKHTLSPVSPQLFLDRQYILSAMGLLSQTYPETALRILKSNLEVV